MTANQELQVQQKRELDKKDEATVPARVFVPTADIFETEQTLTIVLEMPGVQKGNVEINVENNVLTVDGRLDFATYKGLQPVYTEYNIGNYSRSFRISGQIDQSKISAEMEDGTVTLVLPKVEQAKPRRIAVN